MTEKLKVGNKIISTPLYDIVKDIRDELHGSKLQRLKPPRNDNIRLQCVNPEHKGGHEAKPSASIYVGPTVEKVSYGTYSCFTCGVVCSFEHFVAMAFEKSDAWAIEWLTGRYGQDSDMIIFDAPPIEKRGSRNDIERINPESLKLLEDYHPYMTQRKLSKDIIERFQLKFEPRTQCIVFPVYDEKGSLTLLTRRSVNDKTFIIDKNKEKPLYLLYEIIHQNIKSAMICEGQIDSLTAWGYGMPAIATMGAPSDHQIDLLNKSGIRMLYFGFDNDEAGERFRKKVAAKLSPSIIAIPLKFPKGIKDINDMSYDQFWSVVNNA